MKPTHQALTSVLKKKQSGLGSLTNKVTEIRRINQYFQTIIPEELRNHCFVVNLRDNYLVLGAKSASWLTLLRFQAPNALKQIQDRFQLKFITQTRCMVIPPTEKAPSHGNKPAGLQLSHHDADVIKACADTIDDTKLREALLKLAKNEKR